MADAELPFLPPKLLARIFAWTPLVDLWRIRSVCRLWTRIEFTYAPLDHPALARCRRHTTSGSCPVCEQLELAAYTACVARSFEANDALVYAAWAAPYLTTGQLAAILKLHRSSFKQFDLSDTSTFYRACSEGNLEMAQWLYNDLGYTPETRLVDAFRCNDYGEMCCDALVFGNTDSTVCVQVLRAMVLAGAGKTVAWLVGAFTCPARLLLVESLARAKSVAEARALADGFGLTREDLGLERLSKRALPFVDFIHRGRFELAAWFVRRFQISRDEVAAVFRARTEIEVLWHEKRHNKWLLAARWFRQQGLLA